MKINAECVKAVMLTLEDNLVIGEYLQFDDLLKYPQMQDFSVSDIEYTLQQLTESNNIKCMITTYINGKDGYIVESITPDGHKLCDIFRDKNKWLKFKPHIDTAASLVKLLASVSALVP